MEQALAFTSIGFLVSKIIEELKYLRNRDWNAAITLAATWISGVIVTFIAAATTVMEGLVLPGTTTPLGNLSLADQIFIGLTLTSLIAKVYDFQKSFDNSDSAKQPPLTPF